MATLALELEATLVASTRLRESVSGAFARVVPQELHTARECDPLETHRSTPLEGARPLSSEAAIVLPQEGAWSSD